MEPASPQGSLSEEDRQLLRSFMAANRETRWRAWIDGAVFSLIVGAGIAASQLLMRWLPGRLEARGLAVCLRTTTTHHGVLWVPDAYDFTELLRGPGALCTLYVSYLGIALLGTYLQRRRTRCVCQLFSRLFPGEVA